MQTWEMGKLELVLGTFVLSFIPPGNLVACPYKSPDLCGWQSAQHLLNLRNATAWSQVEAVVRCFWQCVDQANANHIL